MTCFTQGRSDIKLTAEGVIYLRADSAASANSEQRMGLLPAAHLLHSRVRRLDQKRRDLENVVA